MDDLEFANNANIEAARRFKAERDALRKAFTDIRFIAEDPIGLTERKQIQKICNAALGGETADRS